MPTRYMPFIRAGHYPAFRELISSELPATYEEWESQHERDKKNTNREFGSRTVRDVAVEPIAFAAWCKMNGMRRTIASLHSFADAQGS